MTIYPQFIKCYVILTINDHQGIWFLSFPGIVAIKWSQHELDSSLTTSVVPNELNFYYHLTCGAAQKFSTNETWKFKEGFRNSLSSHIFDSFRGYLPPSGIPCNFTLFLIIVSTWHLYHKATCI